MSNEDIPKENVSYVKKIGSDNMYPIITQGPRNKGDKHWGMRSKMRILKDFKK